MSVPRRRLVASAYLASLVFGVLVLLLAGTELAQAQSPTGDPLDVWSPPSDLEGGPYALKLARASVDDTVGISHPLCPWFVNSWWDSTKKNLISVGVGYCATEHDARETAGVLVFTGHNVPDAAIFGAGVDFVFPLTPIPGYRCALGRHWAQGQLAITIMTGSPNLDPGACRQLNEQVSRSVTAVAPGKPAPYTNRLLDIFVSVALKGLVGLWVFLAGGPTLFRRICRDTYALPHGQASFVDVGSRAVSTERRSFIWGAAVVTRRLGLAVVGLAVVSIVIGSDWRSSVWLLLGCAALIMVATAVIRRLHDPAFDSGRHTHRRALRERLTSGAMVGASLRAITQAAVAIVLLMFVSGVTFLGAGGRPGAFGREIQWQVQQAYADHAVSALTLVQILLLWSHDHVLELLVLIVPTAGVAFLLNRLGSRLAARSAQALLAQDLRPPVLYLRSFGDDMMRMYGSRLSRRGLLAKLSPFRRRCFEEVIVQRLNVIGPVIAVSDPRRPLPTLGAVKLNLRHGDEWMAEVERHARSSLCVVVSATPAEINEGLRWELQLLAERIGHRRIVLLLGVMPKKKLVTRWRAFIAECGQLPLFNEAAEAGTDGSAQLVVQHPDHGWIGLGAAHRDEWTYTTAIHAVFHVVSRKWQAELAEAGRKERARLTESVLTESD